MINDTRRMIFSLGRVYTNYKSNDIMILNYTTRAKLVHYLPISEPNPASVITKPSSPTNFKLIKSATIDEQPCAIFAKGPA